MTHVHMSHDATEHKQNEVETHKSDTHICSIARAAIERAVSIQWNLRIKDTLGQGVLSFIERVPLFGG